MTYIEESGANPRRDKYGADWSQECTSSTRGLEVHLLHMTQRTERASILILWTTFNLYPLFVQTVRVRAACTT